MVKFNNFDEIQETFNKLINISFTIYKCKSLKTSCSEHIFENLPPFCYGSPTHRRAFCSCCRVLSNLLAIKIQIRMIYKPEIILQ